MKRTVRTRGGRHAVSSALARAIKPAVRESGFGEHDAEVSRLKRLSSLVRWVSSSQTSMRQRNTRRSPASAIAGQATRPAGSEKRLTDAIESITDGFALWDADDRLILCNSRFREFYPSVAPSLNSGADYEQVLRDAMDKGQYCVDGPAEDWLQRRLRAHRVRGGTCEEHLSDGRWLLATEHCTSDG
jgi:PAS domain-containing protein